MSKIGVFDSGLGGVCVLKSLQKRYPNQDFIFLADQKNVPYGNKSKEELVQIVHDNFDWLLSRGVSDILIACNTASSLDLHFNEHVQEIIEPTCSQLIGKDYKKILVVATELCTKLGKYKRMIERNCPNAEVIAKPLPWLAQAIEEMMDPNQILDQLRSDLNDVLDVDCLVLGCTHYPLVTEQFKQILNADIVDSNQIELKYLTQGKGTIEYYTTAEPEILQEKIMKLFNEQVEVKYTLK